MPSPEDNNLISQLSAQKLGPAPGGQTTPGATDPGASPATENPAQTQAKVAPEQKTAQEVATSLVSPTDVDDTAADPALQYIKITTKDGERELSSQQIASTLDRYASLNRDHAEMKPVIDLARRLLDHASKSGVQANPNDLAQFMDVAIRGMQKNPTMGNTQNNEAQRPGIDNGGAEPDEILAKWEEENALSLPPGYKEMPKKLSAMEQALLQTNQLLAQILGGHQTALQGAQAQVDQAKQIAQGERVNAVKQAIGANLNAAQQRLGLPDEAEQDFLNFAFSRGYTMEDFVNPELTMNVATDFKNAMNGPEMERLRAITQRRQSFTGSATASGSGGGESPSQAGGDPFLNSMITKKFG